MAGKNTSTLLTILDDENVIETPGRDGEEYTVNCKTAKTVGNMLYAHVALNWEKDEWGLLPTAKKAIELYFITGDAVAGDEVVMPSGVKFTPTARYETVSILSFDDETSNKLISQAVKGKLRKEAKKAAKTVGTRE